jgi:hypothetical protein
MLSSNSGKILSTISFISITLFVIRSFSISEATFSILLDLNAINFCSALSDICHENLFLSIEYDSSADLELNSFNSAILFIDLYCFDLLSGLILDNSNMFPSGNLSNNVII